MFFRTVLGISKMIENIILNWKLRIWRNFKLWNKKNGQTMTFFLAAREIMAKKRKYFGFFWVSYIIYLFWRKRAHLNNFFRGALGGVKEAIGKIFTWLNYLWLVAPLLWYNLWQFSIYHEYNIFIFSGEINLPVTVKVKWNWIFKV